MIEIKGVYYSYADINALNNISLLINRGEAVSLLGSNGCGKSTLLKLINGLISPDRGIYKFNGEEITSKKLQDHKFSKAFHRKLGFVFQNSDTQLFCGDVYDEIAFGPRQMGMSEEDVANRVEDCLDLLDLQDFRNRTPYHLSGGEKRKVAIASILSMNPDVLTLDEPMSGLDPRTRRWLAEFLCKLNETGKTLIISTHNLDLVSEVSNRGILFDEDHRVAADRPIAGLLEDIELLKKVNFVDDYYHVHLGKEHKHFHDHNY